MNTRVYCCNTKFWDNFVNYILEIYSSDRYRNKTLDDVIKDELAGYSGINITGTPYIEFMSEEDAVVFRLKWS